MIVTSLGRASLRALRACGSRDRLHTGWMDQGDLVTAFRLQAGGCRLFGSPLYAAMMDRALADVESGGPLARYLDGWKGDPVRGFLPLRMLGAVHARVLGGDAPELARFYPTAGGRADPEGAWQALLRVLAEQGDEIRPRLENFPQTNEVRRCTGLLGGFLEAAAHTGLPLRLRELGCSAGLNLQWARYRYQLGPYSWGPDSPVRLATEWEGPAPRLEAPVSIESRAGCDLDPPRLARDADMRLLEGFIWPDQPDRLEALRGAIALARSDPPRVEAARAREWLPAELAAAPDGCCTVVYHSSVWLYIPKEEQVELRQQLEQCGAEASSERPLAWLRHEDGRKPATVEIRLRVWPGGHERFLGMGHPHGRRVEWRDSRS